MRLTFILSLLITYTNVTADETKTDPSKFGFQAGGRDEMPRRADQYVAGNEVKLDEHENQNPKGLKIKNIIILIGDGMGPGQVGLLELFAKHSKYSPYKDGVTNYEKAMALGSTSYSMTEPFDTLVTDSAASATMMSTGKYSGLEMIGVDHKGNKAETLLELAHKKGLATGVISDTRLTHATPAGFTAHAEHRSMEDIIAESFLESEIDLMLSGGKKYFNEERIKQFQKRGYAVVQTNEELEKVKTARTLGLFAQSYMPNAIDVHNKRFPKIPTLSDLARRGLELLSTNKRGMVLMVEAGQIDFASHANDAGLLLHEMLVMDETLQILLDFYEKHQEETLLIITADHETGGFGFTYSTYNPPAKKELNGNFFKGHKHDAVYNFTPHSILDDLFQQNGSTEELFKKFLSLPKEQQSADKLAKMVNENGPFSITVDEAKDLLTMVPNDLLVKKDASESTITYLQYYSGFYFDSAKRFSSKLAKITAPKSNVVWSTGAHTSTPVGFVTLGPPSVTKRFKRLLHTTIWGKELIDLIKE